MPARPSGTAPRRRHREPPGAGGNPMHTARAMIMPARPGAEACRRVRRTDRRGFTLIELLAAIAIISVLISLLLPALAGAREEAKTVRCGAQLYSIGQGLTVCQNEYEGYFP